VCCLWACSVTDHGLESLKCESHSARKTGRAPLLGLSHTPEVHSSKYLIVLLFDDLQAPCSELAEPGRLLPFLDFLSPQYLPPEGVSINEKYGPEVAHMGLI
jgi:hypothetical protein